MPPTRTLAALALTSFLGAPAFAQTPKVDDLLARKPIMAGVQVTTPTGPDLAGCKAEAVNFPKPATGTRVVDAQGKLVRQFIDSTGTGKPDMVYFYLNGVEAYREVDGNKNGKPDQFRWLGPNGGKWGADADEDGIIDVWYVLSQEELSQELFAVLQTREPKRLAPLIPTPAELQSLALPEAEVAKIRDKIAGVGKRIEETANAATLTPAAKWVHAEFGVPHVTPFDSFGGKADLVKHPSATVFYDKGENKVDVLQTGEMVQFGRVWKLTGGPSTGGSVPDQPGGTGGIPVPETIRKLVEKLQGLPTPPNPADLPKYHAARAAVLEEIVAASTGVEQQPWLRQLIDAYTTAAEAGPAGNPALQRLQQWADQIGKDTPKSPAAAYAGFRLLAADYTVRMITTPPDKTGEVQTWWKKVLEEYVAKFPAGEDTPEAMMRLAVAHEIAGKDGEAAAKTWYDKLAAAFPADVRAAKAQGAVKRLQSEGQAFTLPPGTTTTTGQPFDMTRLAGKPVMVYYFANWSTDKAAEDRVVDDLKKLAEVAKAAGDKVAVLTISLDDTPARATAALTAANLAGTHLHAPGGLDRSPLAVSYGVHMVPHLFLVGKDGKVTNRNAQPGPGLKDEVEKLAK